jgi:hypothetical protein
MATQGQGTALSTKITSRTGNSEGHGMFKQACPPPPSLSSVPMRIALKLRTGVKPQPARAHKRSFTLQMFSSECGNSRGNAGAGWGGGIYGIR